VCGVLLAPSTYLPEQFDLALEVMGYRGDGEPGHCNIKRFAGWTIGHVRLAIQDRTPEADQPFDGRYGVYAFVGEFFNHTAGEQLHLLSALVDENIFHQTDGFWAAVAATTLGARVYTDHLGIKPMYFWPKHKIFCSEIEPMFMFEQRPPFDLTYLANCIKWGYDYSGRTPYEGIVQIAPGTRVTVTTNGMITEERYWKWHLVWRQGYLREVVTDAIKNRLIGERPVALLLSGGLDSSIIYYTLQSLGQKVEAFSVENGETEYLPPDVSILDMAPVSLREGAKIMQAPLDLGSLIPQVQLSRAVSAAGYNVCMTGDGADEVFGGYRRAKEYDSQHSDIFCELPYYHLPRLDRVMMRKTIELRSPYLSPQVVACGLALPREMRTEKQALKRAFKGLVPDRIIKRPKHPLKTEAVRTGGMEYRQRLVDAFKKEVTNVEEHN
jgi:asparagine synthetase B (glutamine-hydrolysing)